METTLLYGNGVNLLSENGIEWKALLKKVSGLVELPELNNNTMLYEYIVLPLAVPLADCDGHPFLLSNGDPFLVKNEPEGNIKNGLEALLKNGKSWFYKNMVDIHADHYLTTNYEHYLNEEFTICDGEGYQEDCAGVESLLFNHAVGMSNGHKASLWNIHGSTKVPQSILLGMNEYCKYVVAIEKYLQEDKPSKKSWVDLLTETNVHIVGFGLAFEEIDLWYLLTRRMRRIKRGDEINNKIFFYQIKEKDKCNDAVVKMLEATGVNVIQIDAIKKDGNTDWKKAYQDIYKIIRGNVK